MAATTGQAAQLAGRSVFELSLEELVTLNVTSVSRRDEQVAQAAASIFVITADDIRRSAATTLPEALRLAPNLLVSRLDAGIYAISARGFNSNIANKLLVLVDGRTIYSPLFSGVFWDAQDVFLEDVERIEVISGPGASLWGANSVNGVINVITRSAAQTQGTLVGLQAGPREQLASVRYGGKLGASGSYRLYARAWDTDNFSRSSGIGAADGWKRTRVGFRADWGGSTSAFTLQGEAYDGKSDDRLSLNSGPVDVSGFHQLSRWNRRGSDGSDLQVQGYFDRNTHKDRLLLDENGDVVDIELKHLLAARGAHSLQWGAGVRHAQDRSNAGTLFAFIPDKRRLNWVNVFLQDEINLTGALKLTLGTRFERNSYTGWEVLPNARLGWAINPANFVWTSVSRAVRAPSRVDREIFTPPAPPFVVAGGPEFKSEVAKVFEIGYRARPHAAISYSLTYFYQDYERLKSAELTPLTVFPVTAQNKTEGSVSGFEGWAYWQVMPNWRFSAGFTTIDADLRLKSDSTDPVGPGNLGNNPDYQWLLRSTLSVTPQQELDVTVRRVGELPAFPGNASVVPAYTAVDLRYAWHVNHNLELSLIAQNAFDPYHREWGDRTSGAEVARSIFVKLLWRH
jgi:iron complex outermembrane receptor protein